MYIIIDIYIYIYIGYIIRKYGSTFYIGIDGIKPVQIEISLSYSLILTIAKVKNMLITNDIEKKSTKSCKTGVILVICYFTVLQLRSA